MRGKGVKPCVAEAAGGKNWKRGGGVKIGERGAASRGKGLGIREALFMHVSVFQKTKN